MALIAITRDVNSAIEDCELTYLSRSGIDFRNATRQHEQYQSVLSHFGCEVLVLPTATGLADSVFIEDTALVLDEVAVLCRPGAASRRAEVAGVKDTLRQFRDVVSIQAPGTLDGGDLLVVGKDIYAGLSSRSNESGIEQLQQLVARYGYSVIPVETKQCLHLKSAVSEVAPGVLLINPNWIDETLFEKFELVAVDEQEEHGANALLLGQELVYPTAFPRTAEILRARGIEMTLVDVSELQKAEGAVTCCSLILNA